MRLVKLGQTGSSVSRLGRGTGTAHPSGRCYQTRMGKQELADLLLYGFACGITFWDSAAQYRTYPHIRCALTSAARRQTTHPASGPQAAITYAAGRTSPHSFIIGMLKRSEIEVDCRALEQYEGCHNSGEVRS